MPNLKASSPQWICIVTGCSIYWTTFCLDSYVKRRVKLFKMYSFILLKILYIGFPVLSKINYGNISLGLVVFDWVECREVVWISQDLDEPESSFLFLFYHQLHVFKIVCWCFWPKTRCFYTCWNFRRTLLKLEWSNYASTSRQFFMPNTACTSWHC